MKQQFQNAFHCSDKMCVLYHIALIIAHSLCGLDMDMDMDVDAIIRDENKAETKRLQSP